MAMRGPEHEPMPAEFIQRVQEIERAGIEEAIRVGEECECPACTSVVRNPRPFLDRIGGIETPHEMLRFLGDVRALIRETLRQNEGKDHGKRW